MPKPGSRRLAFLLITALLPFALSAAMIGAAEWVFGHLLTPASFKGSDKSANPLQLFQSVNAEGEAGAVVLDPEVGNLPAASRNLRTRATAPDGRVIYDVHYGIDEWHRRITPGQSQGARRQALLFLGCSFTFGLGLEDKDTLPSVVAESVKDYRVYNYGYQSWGPANVLRRISRPSLSQEVPETGGMAVYLFIDHHLPRVRGSLSLDRFSPGWRSVLPYYFLDKEGALQSRGMLAESRPLETRLFRLLAQSYVLSYFHVDLPSRYSEEDFRLLTAIFQEMRRVLEQKREIKRFYVLFYPGSQLAKPLIQHLNQAGIASLDYSGLDLAHYVKDPSIPGEGLHPSAEAQRFIARLLVRDLDLH